MKDEGGGMKNSFQLAVYSFQSGAEVSDNTENRKL
jgi:hypothetical protein